MTKSELIEQVAAKYPGLFLVDVERVVNVIFDKITDALADGDRVELRGFGAFSVKARAARIGRNPRSGAAVSIPDKFIPYFKPGKHIRDRVDD